MTTCELHVALAEMAAKARAWERMAKHIGTTTEGDADEVLDEERKKGGLT